LADEKEVTLQKGDNPIPRIRVGEIGTTGLKVRSGYIYEETRKELQHPFWNREVKCMLNDPVIAAGVEVYKMWLGRSIPQVIPYDDTADSKQKALFIQQCMDDMEHTFDEFFSDVLSYIAYGYAPIEMVFKKRLNEMGSKYNDGLIGWKKLPIRSQDTVEKWLFSDDGRDLLGMRQDINGVNVNERFNNLLIKHPNGEIDIPIEKLMLFRYNPTRGNPEGKSPLKGAWSAWKFRTQLELDEAVGVQRNMNGCPILYIEPSYMSPDASDDKKAVYEEYKRQIRNFVNNEQSGFILPAVFDEGSKGRLFELAPMEVKGSNQYDTNSIIRRWDLKILTTLLADVLTLGQEGNGSFALSENKTALMQMALEMRLKEISTVIQNTLIKTTFKMNGWDAKYLPAIKFSYPADVEIDNFGKLAQRLGSIEFLPRDGKVVAWVMQQAGYPDYARFENMTSDELEKLFPSYDGKAGTGLGTSGTGNTQSGGANSAKNADNAA
jgi:hypothetical protein